MLAVTHHLIVQLAFRKSTLFKLLAGPIGPTGKLVQPNPWYTNYELLGDDIVIFDKEVAQYYLSLMEMLGVGINLSKSVISTPEAKAFEFAKVTGKGRKDVSALPWKAFISQNTMMGRVNILYALLQRNIVSTH